MADRKGWSWSHPLRSILARTQAVMRARRCLGVVVGPRFVSWVCLASPASWWVRLDSFRVPPVRPPTTAQTFLQLTSDQKLASVTFIQTGFALSTYPQFGIILRTGNSYIHLPPGKIQSDTHRKPKLSSVLLLELVKSTHRKNILSRSAVMYTQFGSTLRTGSVRLDILSSVSLFELVTHTLPRYGGTYSVRYYSSSRFRSHSATTRFKMVRCVLIYSVRHHSSNWWPILCRRVVAQAQFGITLRTGAVRSHILSPVLLFELVRCGGIYSVRYYSSNRRSAVAYTPFGITLRTGAVRWHILSSVLLFEPV